MFWLVCMHVGWMVFINISLFLIPFLCVTYKHLLFHYISYQLVKWLLFFSIKRGENCMYSIFDMSIVCNSYVRECFNAKSFESEIFIFSSMRVCVCCCFFSVLRLPLPLQFCGCVCREYVDFQYAPVNVILFRLFNKLVKLCTYCKIVSKTGATFSINTFVVYANVAHLYGNCVFTNSHKSTLKLCSFWAYNVLFMSIVHSIPIWDIVFVIVSMSREMHWLFLFVPHKHGNFLIIQSRRKNKKKTKLKLLETYASIEITY